MTSAKVNVGAVGEGLGSDGLIHLQSVTSRMDAYMTEVHTKPGLHVGAHRVRQWTAASFAQVNPRFDIGARFKGVTQCARRVALDRFCFVFPPRCSPLAGAQSV